MYNLLKRTAERGLSSWMSPLSSPEVIAMPTQRLKIICSGLVQAVGFRYFVTTTAQMLGLSGFVENLDNGDVLIEAQGTPEQLQTLLARIARGNGYSRIDRLVRYPLPPDPHSHSFEIRSED